MTFVMRDTLYHVPPFPEFSDEDDDFSSAPKDRVIHIRLIHVVWLWVRYEAKRAKVNPSEWIRKALEEFDGQGSDDANKGKVVHVRVDQDLWQRLRKLTGASGKAPAEWARCAINKKLMDSEKK